MHDLRYLWLIGDGDSSVYHSVVTEVPSYGRNITKVECANHEVKCWKHSVMTSHCIMVNMDYHRL